MSLPAWFFWLLFIKSLSKHISHKKPWGCFYLNIYELQQEEEIQYKNNFNLNICCKIVIFFSFFFFLTALSFIVFFCFTTMIDLLAWLLLYIMKNLWRLPQMLCTSNFASAFYQLLLYRFFLNFNCLCVFTSLRFFSFSIFPQEIKPLCLTFPFECCVSHMRPVISLLECDKIFALNRNNGLNHPLMWFTVYLQVRRRVEQRGYVRITRMDNFKQMHLSWLPCYD